MIIKRGKIIFFVIISLLVSIIPNVLSLDQEDCAVSGQNVCLAYLLTQNDRCCDDDCYHGECCIEYQDCASFQDANPDHDITQPISESENCGTELYCGPKVLNISNIQSIPNDRTLCNINYPLLYTSTKRCAAVHNDVGNSILRINNAVEKSECESTEFLCGANTCCPSSDNSVIHNAEYTPKNVCEEYEIGCGYTVSPSPFSPSTTVTLKCCTYIFDEETSRNVIATPLPRTAILHLCTSHSECPNWPKTACYLGECIELLCQNNLDDDEDELTDCDDADCELFCDAEAGGIAREVLCYDETDNDRDGDTDCDDSDCRILCHEPILPEACTNLLDDDGDGLIDCADEDCDGEAGTDGICEYQTELTCNDGFDNDGKKNIHLKTLKNFIYFFFILN